MFEIFVQAVSGNIQVQHFCPRAPPDFLDQLVVVSLLGTDVLRVWDNLPPRTSPTTSEFIFLRSIGLFILSAVHVPVLDVLPLPLYISVSSPTQIPASSVHRTYALVDPVPYGRRAGVESAVPAVSQVFPLVPPDLDCCSQL